MKKLISLALLVFLNACSTIDPTTGQPVYDPVTTAQVKAALAPAVSTTITALVRKQTNEDAATYLRSIGTVFCEMKASGKFDSGFLVGEINKIVDTNVKQSVEVIAIKNALIALYTIYSMRHTVELPQDKWAFHVADLMCSAIDIGLRDAGKPGVPQLTK